MGGFHATMHTFILLKSYKEVLCKYKSGAERKSKIKHYIAICNDDIYYRKCEYVIVHGGRTSLSIDQLKAEITTLENEPEGISSKRVNPSTKNTDVRVREKPKRGDHAEKEEGCITSIC